MYYSSAYECREEQFGQGNCRRTHFTVNSFFLLENSAGKLSQLSICVLFSLLVSEHLSSHGILQERNSYFQRIDSILVLPLVVAASSYRVKEE